MIRTSSSTFNTYIIFTEIFTVFLRKPTCTWKPSCSNQFNSRPAEWKDLRRIFQEIHTVLSSLIPSSGWPFLFAELYGASFLWRLFLFPGILLYGDLSSFPGLFFMEFTKFYGTLLYGDFSCFPGLFSLETLPFLGLYRDSSLWRLFLFPGTLLYGDSSSLRNFTGTLLSEDFSSFPGLFFMETLPLYGTLLGLFSLKTFLCGDFSFFYDRLTESSRFFLQENFLAAGKIALESHVPTNICWDAPPRSIHDRLNEKTWGGHFKRFTQHSPH